MRCPICGTKECCGGYYEETERRLRQIIQYYRDHQLFMDCDSCIALETCSEKQGTEECKKWLENNELYLLKRITP